MKKRHHNKYLSRVSKGLLTGKLSTFHVKRVREILSEYYDRMYLTDFRPYWYDMFDSWSKLKYVDEYNRFSEKWSKDFESVSGIDLYKLLEYVKQMPPARKQTRKPRKPREPKPIRKLKHPEEFWISLPKGGREKVIGEVVFTYKGHEFFIRHENGLWMVTDVRSGLLISRSCSYKEAAVLAESRIESNFDEYLKQQARGKYPNMGRVEA